MSTLAVVAEVLREVAPRALKARQIAELAGSRLPTSSRTPETVVSRDLALEVTGRGASSRFLRVDRGAFVLKEALPTAFYNDHDAYAAQWTRNLIAAGEIAAGVVDERSIRDLKPADVASYRQCHFFNGIAVWPRAIREAGWPDTINVWSGSCPCQGMSSAGKRRGFADERHLWPEWFRLIRACRPAVLLTEQVASKDGRAWIDLVYDDLEGIGYSCQAYDLPACCVGAPHRRQRLYVVAYARERGREIVGASWLHDRGQGCGCLGPVWVGDAGFARGGRDAGALSRAQEVGEGEWIEAGGLADEPVASGAADVDGFEHGVDGASDVEVVRGAADASGHGSAGSAALDSLGFRPGDRIRLDGDPSWGGAVGGYWAVDVEWIYCRPEPGHEDGRWRPAESGTQPLVDWFTADLGRTRSARLRGYGNAIVLPLATVFVEAVIDALVDAAFSFDADFESVREEGSSPAPVAESVAASEHAA